MPLLFGPKNSRMTYTGSPCPHNDLAFNVSDMILKDALRKYEIQFNVTIIPYIDESNTSKTNEAKYFLHIDNISKETNLVDLHIIRNGVEICVKQNLDFQLLTDDLVEMGELLC